MEAGYGNPAYFRRGEHNGSRPELRFRPWNRPQSELRTTVQQRKVKQTGMRPNERPNKFVMQKYP